MKRLALLALGFILFTGVQDSGQGENAFAGNSVSVGNGLSTVKPPRNIAHVPEDEGREYD